MWEVLLSARCSTSEKVRYLEGRFLRVASRELKSSKVRGLEGITFEIVVLRCTGNAKNAMLPWRDGFLIFWNSSCSRKWSERFLCKVARYWIRCGLFRVKLCENFYTSDIESWFTTFLYAIWANFVTQIRSSNGKWMNHCGSTDFIQVFMLYIIYIRFNWFCWYGVIKTLLHNNLPVISVNWQAKSCRLQTSFS